MSASTDSRRAIVTGGAGFIGSHLVDRLLNDGFDVIVLDNFSTGRPENLARVANHPRLKLHQVDITDHDKILPLFEGAGAVFHLAALADIVPSIQFPLRYYRSNVDGTVSVLEAARKANVRRFLYTASSSCYGIPVQYPTPETAPIPPQYPLAPTKYSCGKTALAWSPGFGLSG